MLTKRDKSKSWGNTAESLGGVWGGQAQEEGEQEPGMGKACQSGLRTEAREGMSDRMCCGEVTQTMLLKREGKRAAVAI